MSTTQSTVIKNKFTHSDPSSYQHPLVFNTDSLDAKFCLCGCSMTPKGSLSKFVQGHDAKLKARLDRGEPVSYLALQYAIDNWGYQIAEGSPFLEGSTKNEGAVA